MDKDVLSLFEMLEQKNSYLLEFHKLNTDQINLLSQGLTDNFENFYYSREILLNAINKLDSKMAKKDSKEGFKINKPERKKLMDILNLKKRMVLSILDQDLTIISLVEKLNQNKNIRSIAS